MITRVRVKNFKSLADVDVTLGPLTVLVGRNGAGKSAFLDCLRFLKDGVRDLNRAISSRGGFNHACKRSALKSQGFEIRINAEDTGASYEYFVRIARDAMRDWFVAEEKAVTKKHATQEEIWFQRNDMAAEMHPSNTIPAYEKGFFPAPEPQTLFLTFMLAVPAFMGLYGKLNEIFFCNVAPDELRRPQTAQPYLVMNERGTNFASALEAIKRNEQTFRSLLVDLQHLIPGITDIDVKMLESDELLTRLKHTQENTEEAWFNLSQESDGTIRALALLTSICSVPESCLLAIEEPELALYPDALGLISDILRGAALKNQVLFTTQSPDLIAHFGANELLIVENENGATHIGPLTEHQRQIINEQIFGAGDLLRIEGLHTAPVVIAPDLPHA